MDLIYNKYLHIRVLLIFLSIIGLSGCSSIFSDKFSSDKCYNTYDEDYSGHYKVGAAYTIKNKTYEPKVDWNHDEVGEASWYGSGFHCKKTANGEVFNKMEMSAAHRTLPLPSVARVTNLKNGKSVTVIINDRGPFAKDRIIDLSEKAAHEIDMKRTGIAKVRVQFLPKETEILLAKLPSHKKIALKKSSKKLDGKIHLKDDKKIDKNIRVVALKNAKVLKKTSKEDTVQLANNILEPSNIRIGIYKTKENAVKVVKNLSHLGGVKLSQIINENGNKLYQVDLRNSGKYRQNMDEILGKVKKLGHNDAHIITE